MERKLVTVRAISEILPIEGADKIELAKVGGWQCVVSKGEFKPGDLGIYFEIDSFLPIEPRFEFLRKSCYRKFDGGEGFRIKTMKLRGTLSQGLLIPISKLDEFSSIAVSTELDYSDLLKVKKWDPPLSGYLTGKAKGNWPSFLCKTDEERIQNLSKYFNPEYFKGVSIPFEVSEKVDGMSGTFFFNDGEFGVCSRNLWLEEVEEDAYWSTAKELKINDILKTLNLNVALQGEFAGEGIQKNKLQLTGKHFFIFNIWDINSQRHLVPKERYELLGKISEMNPLIEHVPILEQELYVFDKFKDIDSLLKYAEGNSSLNKNKKREGLVFKSNLLWSGQVISFKAINNQYLLKEEE
jgi:RNA ligase (TIGR02306 family)